MDSGFKNNLKGPKGKTVKTPWNFEQPPYDERSSCYVNAGTYMGVGKKQPVGSDKVKTESPIPMTKDKGKDYYVNPSSIDVV